MGKVRDDELSFKMLEERKEKNYTFKYISDVTNVPQTTIRDRAKGMRGKPKKKEEPIAQETLEIPLEVIEKAVVKRTLSYTTTLNQGDRDSAITELKDLIGMIESQSKGVIVTLDVSVDLSIDLGDSDSGCSDG